MEPTDLNPPGDESLERWLRSGPRTPIADDGFTARVLAELPPPARRAQAARYTKTRIVAMFVGATAGIATVWAKGVLSAAAIDELVRVGSRFADPSTAFALAAAAAVLLFLYVPQLRRLWT